jgi:hypothetical protein
MKDSAKDTLKRVGKKALMGLAMGPVGLVYGDQIQNAFAQRRETRDLANQQAAQTLARGNQGNFLSSIYNPDLQIPDNVNLNASVANQLAQARRSNAQAVTGAFAGGANQGVNAFNERVNNTNYTMPNVTETAGTKTVGNTRNITTPTAPAGAGSFDNALKWLSPIEGGYANNPNDRGGATMRGITTGTYDAYRKSKGLPPQDVRKLTQAEHDDIYRKQYWEASGASKIGDKNLALAVFDSAVNHGVKKAKDLLKQSGGDLNKFMAVRDQYYKDIIRNDPSQSVFKEGWENRMSSLRKATNGNGMPSSTSKAIAGGARAAGVANPDDLGAARVKLSAQGALPTNTASFQAPQLPPGQFIPPETIAAINENNRLGVAQGANIAQTGYTTPYNTQQAAMQTALLPYATQNQTVDNSIAMRQQQEAQQQNVITNELKRREQEQLARKIENDAIFQRGSLENEQKKLAAQDVYYNALQASAAAKGDTAQKKPLMDEYNVNMRGLSSKNVSEAQKLELQARNKQIMLQLDQMMHPQIVGGVPTVPPNYQQAMQEIGNY